MPTSSRNLGHPARPVKTENVTGTEKTNRPVDGLRVDEGIDPYARGYRFRIIGGGFVSGACNTQRFQSSRQTQSIPPARVGDDAHIVPLSGCPARPVKTEYATETEKRTAR